MAKFITPLLAPPVGRRYGTVYSAMEGHLSGPLAPPLSSVQPLAIPLPEAVILRKVQQVHVLVDGPMHDLLRRVTQLTGTLEDAGVDVPDKPPPS